MASQRLTVFTVKLGICAILLLNIFYYTQAQAVEDFTSTNHTLQNTENHDINAITIYNSPLHNSVKIELSLEKRLELEQSKWHWYPYKRISYFVTETGLLVENFCQRQPAIDDFPHNVFTHEQRLQGAIILHFLVAFYFFIVLATICSRYFLPAVECICEALGIPTDVAAATFMALATTTPEFFTNTISTFIADSDMGFGTIIGSMLFNTLGVAACAGLATQGPIQIEWWPISRDSVLFTINLIMLTVIIWDGQVNWYESLIQVGMLSFYFTVMFQNTRLERFFTKHVSGWFCCRGANFDSNVTQLSSNNDTNGNVKTGEGIGNLAFEKSPSDEKENIDSVKNGNAVALPVVPDDDDDDNFILWEIPEGTTFTKVWWAVTWPIRLLLTVTIPRPKTYPKLYPLTFIMCMVMLAVSSYVIFWMVAIIGFTFGIPESVMGMTFLAAGGCLPEATSAVIMIRKGSGALGVSNSLGANSLSIMFSLGLPWLIRNFVDGAWATGAHIAIHSYGIEFIVISLILAVGVLYIIVTISKYKLRKTIGVILVFTYLIFVTFAVLVEMDVFFTTSGC